MERHFKLKGFIARFKKVKNGYRIAVGEPALNHLSRPQYVWLAIWSKKADAIAPRLRNGKTFEFSGTITTNLKDGRTYLNHGIDTWLEIQREPKPAPSRRPQTRDDDWFVPACRQEASRRYEGFSNR